MVLPTKKFGYNEWTIKNLNVNCFSNGELIPEVRSTEEWRNANLKGCPAWCFYDNDPNNGNIYGRLYNWYAVSDVRGLCPRGWHIPSDLEWKDLMETIGGYNVAGKLMKSKEFWQYSNNPGTNESGLNVLPSGYRNFYGDFFFLKQHGYFWSSSEHYNHLAWYHTMDYFIDEVLRYYNVKGNGFPCRCIKD
jgi:uncharacterized protein (TIGR02145 family)